MRRDETLQLLSAHLEKFKQKYNVESLSLFGSMARNEANADSDIDILVEYKIKPGLFGYLNFKNDLEQLCNSPIDLVTIDALKHQLRGQILAEAIRVH